MKQCSSLKAIFYRHSFYLSLTVLSVTGSVLSAIAGEEGGGWVSGGGDVPPALLEQGRLLAADILGNIQSNKSYNLIQNVEVRNWLQTNIKDYIADIQATKHDWSTKSTSVPTCAQTSFSKNASISFYLDNCINTVNNKEDGTLMVLHEAIHHFGYHDEDFPNTVAAEVMHAWGKLRNQIVPTCSEYGNYLVKHMPGTWYMDPSTTIRLGGELKGRPKSTVSFTVDLSVTKKFKSIGTCAYQAGYMTRETRDGIQQSNVPFIVSERQGSIVLVSFADKSNGEKMRVQHITVARGDDPSNDMLFLADAIQTDKVTAFSRSTFKPIAQPPTNPQNPGHGNPQNPRRPRPGRGGTCRPTIFHRCP